MIPTDAFKEGLRAMAARVLPGAERIEHLGRVSAGATLETWSFDAVGPRQRWPLILRRSPGGLRASRSLSLADEAALVRVLGAAGVKVAQVVHTLDEQDRLGDGFVMIRIPGETIARKVLRDAGFDAIRAELPAQLAQVAASIHRVDTESLPTSLATLDGAATLAELRGRYQGCGVPRPVMELAFRWLEDHVPASSGRARLVHGDYRNGNVIFGPEGVRAVLDWEIAHLGDPVEDLAWLCLPPWRFGNLDKPAGGLGSRESLLRAYEAASGEPVDPIRFRFWELLGSVRWGVGCAGMLDWYRSGRDRTVERAMIARRVSENEMDLMRLLTGSARHDG